MEKTQVAAGSSKYKLVFQTEHYKVVIGVIPDLHETPESMKQKYIIVNPEDSVIYGVAGGRGVAIIAALQAENELATAQQAVDEMEARKIAKPPAEDDDSPFPKLQ